MIKLIACAAIIFVGLGSLGASAAEPGATGVVIKQVPLTYKDIATKSGHEMYDQLCAVCHGVTGKGDGPAGPALSNPVPDLTQFGAETGSEYHAQLESVISGMNRSVHKDIVGMPLWFREFQYVRRDKFGHPRTTYANLKIHSLAEYVEELALAGSD
jgi:mono/diheme cytochrome c family protein